MFCGQISPHISLVLCGKDEKGPSWLLSVKERPVNLAYIGILEKTFAAIVALSFPMRSVDISAEQCQTSYCMHYKNVASWTQSVCLTSLLQCRSVSYSWKYMVHHEEENQPTVTTDWASSVPTQLKNIIQSHITAKVLLRFWLGVFVVVSLSSHGASLQLSANKKTKWIKKFN